MLHQLKQKIARNFIISFVGRFLAGVLGIFSLAFTTRALGSEGFGEYNIVFAYLYVFSVFADFGLNSLLAREISKPDVDEKEVISEIFSTKLFLLIVFFFAAFLLVFLTPYSKMARIGILVASGGFAISSLTGVLMGIFQKYLKTIIPAISDVVARSAQLLLAYVLYKNNAGLLSFLAVFVIGSAIQFLFVYSFAQKRIPFKLKFDFYQIKNILNESWPLALSAVLVMVYFKGDTIILSFLRSPYDVGIYGIAYKILENIIFFPIMFVGLVMPLLSKYFISDRDAFKKVFQKTFDFLVIIAVPLVLGGIYVADNLIEIIAGAGFEDSALPLRILFIAVFFIFLGALFGSAIIAINKQKSAMYAYGVAAVFNIVANIYFINRYSYVGAAWVTVATELMITGLMFFIIYKTTLYWPDLSAFLKALFASLIMLGSLYLSHNQNLFALVILGAVSYAIFMYLLRGISKEDISMLIARR